MWSRANMHACLQLQNGTVPTGRLQTKTFLMEVEHDALMQRPDPRQSDLFGLFVLMVRTMNGSLCQLSEQIFRYHREMSVFKCGLLCRKCLLKFFFFLR